MKFSSLAAVSFLSGINAESTLSLVEVETKISDLVTPGFMEISTEVSDADVEMFLSELNSLKEHVSKGDNDSSTASLDEAETKTFLLKLKSKVKQNKGKTKAQSATPADVEAAFLDLEQEDAQARAFIQRLDQVFVELETMAESNLELAELDASWFITPEAFIEESEPVADVASNSTAPTQKDEKKKGKSRGAIFAEKDYAQTSSEQSITPHEQAPTPPQQMDPYPAASFKNVNATEQFPQKKKTKGGVFVEAEPAPIGESSLDVASSGATNDTSAATNDTSAALNYITPRGAPEGLVAGGKRYPLASKDKEGVLVFSDGSRYKDGKPVDWTGRPIGKSSGFALFMETVSAVFSPQPSQEAPAIEGATKTEGDVAALAAANSTNVTAAAAEVPWVKIKSVEETGGHTVVVYEDSATMKDNVVTTAEGLVLNPKSAQDELKDKKKSSGFVFIEQVAPEVPTDAATSGDAASSEKAQEEPKKDEKKKKSKRSYGAALFAEQEPVKVVEVKDGVIHYSDGSTGKDNVLTDKNGNVINGRDAKQTKGAIFTETEPTAVADSTNSTSVVDPAKKDEKKKKKSFGAVFNQKDDASLGDGLQPPAPTADEPAAATNSTKKATKGFYAFVETAADARA